MKRIIKFFIFILVLFLLIGLGSRSIFGAVDKTSTEPIEIQIKDGDTASKLADNLKENNLIKSKLAFKLKAKKENIAGHLQVGNYIVEKNMDIDRIISTIKSGPIRNIVKFTIPEGFEIPQTAEKLASLGLVDRERFIELTSDKSLFEEKYEFLKLIDDNQSLEGYLYPATYEVYEDSKEEDIIIKMLDAFNTIYTSELKKRMENTSLSFNEIVTLASIIEREGKLDKERPLMSAVFYNRMDKGIKLQSCATVQYILGERKPVLSNQDTRIPSPYNTYLHQGLPPAPIAAPGKTSLIAALEPADVDYLYFVLTGEDGSHTFTKSYGEHLKAKSKNS